MNITNDGSQNNDKININYIIRQKCAVCENDILLEKMKMRDYDAKLGIFSLLHCSKCNMYYTSPYPDAETLPNLYMQRNTKNFDGHNIFIFDRLKDFFAKKELKRYLTQCEIKPATFVDFGTGNGRYACMLQSIDENIDVTGVDFALHAPIRFNADKHKFINYLETQSFYENNQKYDMIFLRHVLEHVEFPINYLNNMLNKLNDNGTIIVEVPNIKNGLCKVFGGLSPSFSPLFHLVHFTPQNMKSVLNQLNISYKISQTEMPLMSNIIATIFGCNVNTVCKCTGVVLYPVQLLLNLIVRNKSTIVVLIKKQR